MRIQPEPIRKAAMKAYAELQIFKLKMVAVLGFMAWAAHGFPGV